MKLRQARGTRLQSQLFHPDHVASSLTEKSEDLEFIRDLPSDHPIRHASLTLLDDMIESEYKVKEITSCWEQTPDSFTAILLHPLRMARSMLFYRKQSEQYRASKRKFHCADIGLTALDVLAEDTERGRTTDECQVEIALLLAKFSGTLSGRSAKYEVGQYFADSHEFLAVNDMLMEVAQTAIDFAN